MWDNITNYPPKEKKLGYGVWQIEIGNVYRGHTEITYKNNQHTHTAHSTYKTSALTNPSGIVTHNHYYVLEYCIIYS